MAKSIPENLEWEINATDEMNQILSSETALNAFRVIQEAIQNVLKHSRASKITIVIKEDSSAISVQITDNGIGFIQQFAPEGMQHLGLFNMRNRVENLSGKFELVSKVGEGTAVEFTLPF